MDLFEVVLELFGSFLMLSFLSFLWFGASWAFILSESMLIGSVYAHGLFTTLDSVNKSAFKPISTGTLWLLLPVLVGCLAFTRYTKYRWIVRYTTSIQSGIGLGLATAAIIRGDIIGPIEKTIRNLVANTGWTPTMTGTDILSGIVLLVGVFTTFTFYMYSEKYSTPFYAGRLKWLPKIGRAFMFAALGYKIQIRFPVQELVIAVRRTFEDLSLFLRG